MKSKLKLTDLKINSFMTRPGLILGGSIEGNPDPLLGNGSDPDPNPDTIFLTDPDGDPDGDLGN